MPNLIPVDLVIKSRWTIPVEPTKIVLEHNAVIVDKKRILAILPWQKVEQSYKARTTVTLPNHVLLPGFINAHTHSPMTLFRGLADDLPLMTWLKDHIWPAEQAWLQPQFIKDGTELAIAEMIRSGTTCFNEHYFFPEVIATATHKAGMRACIGATIIDAPTPWSTDADNAINQALSAHEKIQDYPLITTALAPHAPYTVSDNTFKKIQKISEENHFNIHIHTHETADEIEASLKQYGKRPLTRLAELGFNSPRFRHVHMTQVNAEDIALLQESQAHVISCPESNLKLASGFCPVQKLLDAGINVGLGTDGAASNNDLDMLSEMRTMALIAKATTQDLTAIDANVALRIATYNGAKLLGLQDQIGSIEIGKCADLIAVDLSYLNTLPVYNPLSQLVYATNSQQVSHVWVNGKCLLDQGQLTTLNYKSLQKKAAEWHKKIVSTANQHETTCI